MSEKRDWRTKANLLIGEIAARAITRQWAITEGVSKAKQDAYVETNWRRAHEIVVAEMAAGGKAPARERLGAVV